MKDSDSVKIKKLVSIVGWARTLFVVGGITSMAIAIIGSLLVGMIVGIVGRDKVEWLRAVFALFAFVLAGSSSSLALIGILNTWIAIIRLRSKSLTLRSAISEFVACTLFFLLAGGCGFGLIWWAIKTLIDPGG